LRPRVSVGPARGDRPLWCEPLARPRIALAKGLNALFVAFGIDLPQKGTVIETRTVIVSLVVGIGITMLATW
jgi:hypothetical protein